MSDIALGDCSQNPCCQDRKSKVEVLFKAKEKVEEIERRKVRRCRLNL
jgi:hypothetical protein